MALPTNVSFFKVFFMHSVAKVLKFIGIRSPLFDPGIVDRMKLICFQADLALICTFRSSVLHSLMRLSIVVFQIEVICKA